MFCAGQTTRNFGIMQEYNERKNRKLTNNVLCTDRNMFWVTSSRPSNFGDPLDVKMFEATGWIMDEPHTKAGEKSADPGILIA